MGHQNQDAQVLHYLRSQQPLFQIDSKRTGTRVLLLRHRDEWAAWLRAEAEMLDFLGRKFPHVVPPYGFKTSVGTS